jgi:hypothetical protein
MLRFGIRLGRRQGPEAGRGRGVPRRGGALAWKGMPPTPGMARRPGLPTPGKARRPHAWRNYGGERGGGGKGGGGGCASRREPAGMFEARVSCGSQGERSSLASWQGQRDNAQDRAGQTDAVWAQEGAISRGGALAQRRGFGTCGWKGVGTPNRRPTCSGSAAATARVHPEWVRRHCLARQCRIPPRLRKGGAASVLGRLGNPSSRAGSTPPSCKTERRARGLDSVARDNPADSLMPQDGLCLPYPHSTGPGPTRQGVGPTWGRAPASDRWPNQVGHLHPAGCLIVRGAPPLSASQAGFGLPEGCLAPLAGPAPTAAASTPRRKATLMGATRTQYHLAWPTRVGTKRYQWTSRRDRPPAAPGTAGPPSGSEMPDHPAGPLQHACGLRDGKFYKSPKL